MLISFPQSGHSPSHADFSVEMVKAWLNAAIRCGASDVHIQPHAKVWEVSFRIDGVLQPGHSFPRSHENDPVARLMALASLPSYLGGVPQEGPLRWITDEGNEREMRLGIFPTVHGHRAAIRVMDERESIRDLDQLGFDERIQNQLQSICDAREGLLLVAGPTGSGKTTTLYACLGRIASGLPRRSVLSIEDPVESVIDSISQSQLQPTSGLTLGGAMRAAMRQDAEVLLVSEIRDVETAEAVIGASMTGHLCFSSIHAGSIGSTLRRLASMNLPSFAIQSGLRGIVCQRLLRRRCDRCQETVVNPLPIPPERSYGRSCEQCHGTGYHGRIPIAQMISFDGSSAGQSVLDALAQNQPAGEIDAIAERSGIESLHGQASRYVDEGQTDAAEVYRVLGRSR